VSKEIKKTANKKLKDIELKISNLFDDDDDDDDDDKDLIER